MPIRILVIDDNEDFGQDIVRAFELRDVESFTKQPDMHAVLNSIDTHSPTDILLDDNLGNGLTGALFISSIAEFGKDKFKDICCWFITGSDKVAVDINSIRKIHDFVKPTWFRKPVNVDEIIETIKKDHSKRSKTGFILPEEFKNFPLPLRVINEKGAVLHIQEWTAGSNVPAPSEFFPFFKDAKAFPIEFWGRRPNAAGSGPDPDFGPYRIHSFFPVHTKNYLIQFSEKMDRVSKKDLKETIQRIFRSLRGAGFKRARYFEVIETPDTYGIMKLLFSTPSNPAEGKEFPIPKYFHKIAEKLKTKFKKDFVKQVKDDSGEQQLYFKILMGQNDPKDDEDLARVKAPFMLEPNQDRIMVPAFSIEPGRKFKTIGFFFFDQIADSNRIVQEGGVGQLNEGHLRTIKHTIRSAVRHISFLEKIKRSRQKLKNYDQLKKLEQEFYGKLNRIKIEEKVLNFAMKFTCAESGFFLYKGDANIKITRSRGIRFDKVKALSFNIDDNNYIGKAWKHRQPMYKSKFSPRRFSKKHPEQNNVTKINGDLKKWFSEIKSVAIIPICTDKQIIGMISLNFNTENALVKTKTGWLELLAQRSFHALKAADLFERRRLWERTFMHEIKKDLYNIGECLDAIPPEKKDENIDLAHFYRENLLYLSDDFRDVLQEKIALDTTTSFKGAYSNIQYLVDLLQGEIDDKQQELAPQPPEMKYLEKVDLVGDAYTFRRIINIILDNVVKFGKTKSTITISHKLTRKNLILKLANQTDSTRNDIDRAFEPHYIYRGTSKAGSHIGLAAARKIMKALRGSISLKLEDEKDLMLVETVLKWPLYK